MKAVILAGGMGTRLAEETTTRPKPMVEIGGRPILWHVMKIYSSFGVTDFIICVGHKGYMIKEYFAHYFLHMSDVTFDLAANSMEVHKQTADPWRVTLVDTGEETQTGGRIKRVRDYVKEDEAFALTYGDGVGDINRAAGIPSFARAQRDGDCRQTSETLWCHRDRPRSSSGFQGEARRRRRMDKWGLLHPFNQGP